MSGRYQYIRKLATGGMAEIYLAKTQGPGGFEKRLVVKRILPHLAERPAFLEMFFAEARIAAQLAHPNIVQIFDFGEEDGSHLIAMEYVDGLNLRVLSRWAKATEPVSCALAARIISLACEGLAYAHEFVHPETGQPLNLVHRDVSADNIMVSRTGSVKVLDFGIARIEGEDLGTGIGERKGKIAYMPVEQLQGDDLDLRVDVFALGVVLYLLLAGERPWERKSEIGLINAILNEPPTPLRQLRPDVPPELDEIVMRALCRDRDERYQSCRELQAALEHFITDTGETITPTQLGVFVTRALAAGAGSGAISATGSGSSSRSQATPPPPPKASPQHLAVTTPGVMSPLLKEFAQTVAGAPSPALLARLRAKAAEESDDDDVLGPEPTTSRIETPQWSGSARDLLREQATVVIAPRPSPARPASADGPPDGRTTLKISAVKALSQAAGDSAHTLKVSTAELFGPPPASSAAVTNQLRAITRPEADTPAPADDFFAAASTAKPRAAEPPPALFAPPPPPRRPSGAFPAAPPLPEAELFAPPPPRGAPESAAPVPSPEATLFAPPPPAKSAPAPLPEPELFAPPPPPKRASGAFPAASPVPDASLFAPPPPPKSAPGAALLPAAELFAPPPPKHPSGSPAPDAGLFAPPPPPKHPSGVSPAPDAGLFAPPPPPRSAPGAAPLPASELFAPPPQKHPSGVSPAPDAGLFAPPPPPKHPSGVSPAPDAGLFAPPPPPRSAPGAAPLPASELFAPPPPKHPSGVSPAPDAGLFAPPPPPKSAPAAAPPPPKHPSGVSPAPDAGLFAPPPPPRSAPGAAPLPASEVFAPPPPKHPSGVGPAPDAGPFAPPPHPQSATPLPDVFAPPPPPKRQSGAFPAAPPSSPVVTTAPPPSSPGAPPRAPPPSAPIAPPAGADLFSPPPAPGPRPPSPSSPAAPRSSAPAPRASSPSGLRAQAPVPVRGFESAQLLPHHPARGLPPAVLTALRTGAAAERAQQLMRRFPLIASRMMELAPELTPRVEQLCAAMLDALLLADEHQLLLRLLERTKTDRFGGWLRGELLSPLRMLALADRLRAGMPSDLASLLGWLKALGPGAIPQLVEAIDSLEQGPAQDVLCRALAALLSGDDLALVAGRLDETPPRNAAAMAFVLEATGSSERAKLFNRVYARRDVPLTLQVMTGRARVKGPETLSQLEAALGDRVPEVRLHALKLMADLDNPAAGRLLFDRTETESFDKLSDDERAATFVALAQIRDPQTFTRLGEVLDEKTSLIGRKQSIAKKLAIIDGLSRSPLEEAQALLVRAAEDRTQPDEVLNAASRALMERRPSGIRSVADESAWLRRLVCLDLFGLARAASVIDLSGGQLDPALSRLRDSLRRLVSQLGRVDLVVGGEGVLLNGASVPLQLGAANVAPQVAKGLSERDLQSFTLEGPVPVAELRAFLSQLCDPDGTIEAAAHVASTTFSGRVVQPNPAQLISGDQGAKASELYRAAVDLLQSQRRAFFAGVLPDVLAADALLRELARTWASSGTRLLSVIPPAAGDEAFAVHAVNTACVGMAFANDLQLGLGALREIAQVALFWTLAQTGLPPQRLPTPGAATAEDVRLRLATLFLSQEKGRRAASSAVVAIDAGLDAPKNGQRGAGNVATIVALAEAFDALAVGAGLGHVAALEQLQSTWAHRFNADLLDLFVAWATEQCGSRPPPKLKG